jgi:hypothetical protein
MINTTLDSSLAERTKFFLMISMYWDQLIQPARSCLIFRHHRPVVLALAVRKCAD